MTNITEAHAKEFRTTLVSCVVVPIIVLWGIFSNGPIFSLVAGVADPVRLGMNLFFLATGLWGAAGAYAIYRVMMWSGSGARKSNGSTRAYLGVYAAAWCVLYFVFIYMPK